MSVKIPEQKLLQAIESNTFGTTNIGFCLSCGEENDGCEPDARKYKCAVCEERTVYGAEQILLMGEYE